MATKKNWYAIYTKPRFEKKVQRFFELKGIECYCPVNRVRKKWSDRYKVVEEPLFKSYVFVRLTGYEIPEVRLTEGVVNFVYWLGKPAVIRDSEIVTIKKFLREYEHVRAERIEMAPGQRVKITSGMLMDREGVVLKSTKDKIFVVLSDIGYRLVAEMGPQEIDILQ